MARVIRRKKDELFDLAQRMYKSFYRRITPIYPWVLVRVLPKEQQLGKIWMPESQNKVMYEGIVLETWQPFLKAVQMKEVDCPSRRDYIEVKSELQLGDHVIFPHFEGMPVPYLNEEEKDAYRLVRELARPGSKDDEKCVIYGKLEYQEPIEEQLFKALPEAKMLYGEGTKAVIKGLLRDFYVVRKTAEPRTTSGYNGPR